MHDLLVSRSFARTFSLAATAVAVGAGSIAIPMLNLAPAHASEGKVYVCKYVNKPGTDAETLKRGKNPILVSVNSIKEYKEGKPVQIGDHFSDAQERSIVVGFGGGPVLDITACPGWAEGNQPTASASTSASASATATATTSTSTGTGHGQAIDKVYVCKYVTKPNGTEVLKDGKNPILVSANSIVEVKQGQQVKLGDSFADGQGRSVVVGFEGDTVTADMCPTPGNPQQPTATPTQPSATTPGQPTATPTKGGGDAIDKVYVCKYVTKPNGTEVLKDGKNPILVSVNSIVEVKQGQQVKLGDSFADGQGRSVVVGFEGDSVTADMCPTPGNPQQPTATPTAPTTKPTCPDETEKPKPSETPKPTTKPTCPDETEKPKPSETPKPTGSVPTGTATPENPGTPGQPSVTPTPGTGSVTPTNPGTPDQPSVTPTTGTTVPATTQTPENPGQVPVGPATTAPAANSGTTTTTNNSVVTPGMPGMADTGGSSDPANPLTLGGLAASAALGLGALVSARKAKRS